MTKAFVFWFLWSAWAFCFIFPRAVNHPYEWAAWGLWIVPFCAVGILGWKTFDKPIQ